MLALDIAYKVTRLAVDIALGPDLGDQCRDHGHGDRYQDTAGVIRCGTCAMRLEP